MLLSRISPKGQATIPAEVRRYLKLAAGDHIGYVIESGRVVIRKVQPLDAEFVRASQAIFTEWASPADDKAYRDL